MCGRCVLGDQLATHLDDGTGRVRPELAPLYDRIVAMPRPRTGILWLSKPHVPPILRALARGQVPLTQDGLSTLTPLRSVVHIRDLLMASGVLPPGDRHLLLFEQWLHTWLVDFQNDQGSELIHDTTTAAEAAEAAEPASSPKQILRQYATWHVLRRLYAGPSASTFTRWSVDKALLPSARSWCLASPERDRNHEDSPKFWRR